MKNQWNWFRVVLDMLANVAITDESDALIKQITLTLDINGLLLTS